MPLDEIYRVSLVPLYGNTLYETSVLAKAPKIEDRWIHGYSTIQALFVGRCLLLPSYLAVAFGICNCKKMFSSHGDRLFSELPLYAIRLCTSSTFPLLLPVSGITCSETPLWTSGCLRRMETLKGSVEGWYICKPDCYVHVSY